LRDCRLAALDPKREFGRRLPAWEGRIMPYAAAIKSAGHAPKNLLESIAPSFASAIATIRSRESEWILESSSFEPYESDEQLYGVANGLVSQIHGVLALYMGLYEQPLSVYALLRLADDDRLIARRRYITVGVNIFRPASQALNPTASGSLATIALSRAATDPEISEALSLVGHDSLTWGRIYDIIEFLGINNRIIKRTANHYRHMGNPKNSPLPKNPPTLAEASRFARDSLRAWISTRT
jgi:hypothetical protein